MGHVGEFLFLHVKWQHAPEAWRTPPLDLSRDGASAMKSFLGYCGAISFEDKLNGEMTTFHSLC